MQQSTNNNATPETGTANLLSPGFCELLELTFYELGNTVFDKILVTQITCAYYVMLDLKGGIPIGHIESDRLRTFQNILLAYLVTQEYDELDERLLKLCVDRLENNY